MFANARRPYALLLSLLPLGVLAVLLAPAAGNASGDKALSSRLIDTSPPEPPHQHDAWTPPPSKVPHNFVTAVRLLFEQGFADPRGCDYRAIEVRTDGGVTPTHGWVLPARRGDEQRYAVCWNGLVYAVISHGNKADLAADVQSVIRRRNQRMEQPEPGWRPRSDEARAVWHQTLGDGDDLATALLLRLGEGEGASALWTANNPPPKETERDEQTKTYLYPSLSRQFARVWFQRLRGAHQRGDDPLALSDACRLTTFTNAAFAEAKACAPNGELAPQAFLRFLDLLPALLADQERRAAEGPRAAVVCIGPGRHPDAAKRIAALIARLDESGGIAASSGNGYRGSAAGDAIVQALIREGEPALEPLLQCYAEDRRLTRTIYAPSDRDGRFREGPQSVAVRQEALTAIRGILRRLQIEPFSSDDLPQPATLAQEAAAIRNHVKTAKRLPPEERYFQLLADDGRPDDWLSAARVLVRNAEPDRPPTALWSASAFGLRDDRPKLLGEPLRGKPDRPVTELLLRRIDQCEANDREALIDALRTWEPQAAREPLARQMKRLQQAENWAGYGWCVTARCELGDRAAVDEYVAWIASTTPQRLGDVRYGPFGPMERYPKHPGMAAAAETLFGNEKSPWLPLVGNTKGRIHDLIATDMLRLPAFRKAVLKELANKGGEGTVRVRRDGCVSMNLPGVTNLSQGRGGGWWWEREIPLEGIEGTFRICDYVAWTIGEEFAAAPRCELYWPEDKRDDAVRDCAAFLRHYGDYLFRDPNYLKRDQPATAADARSGKAIFSLVEDGEARVVRGLDLTLPARWVTLPYRPYETEETDPLTGAMLVVTKYRQDGRIVQAEEVLKDGKWRRYYGFVGSNHVARVAAEEIEFPPPEPRWTEPREWVRLGAGLHARLEVPPLKVELIDGFPPRLPAAAPLTFGLVVRNGRGVEQPAPALDKCVRLRLLYSPETVSRQGALIPQATRAAEWTELKPKAEAAFQQEKGKPLAVVEERQLAAFDLRQWFDVSKPGFYRLHLLPAVQEPGAVPEVSEVRFSLAPSER